MSQVRWIRFLSRKFLLVLLAEAAGVAALFLKDMTGTEFVALITALNVSYHYANVLATRQYQRQQDDS
jgi:hypothetical protein